MVATKSPSRILLVYTYREGEYATKVDIIILRSHRWEEGYFPPPEDNTSREGRRSQSHSQHYGPLLSLQAQSSSPSPSTETPSEPTIDLFAWLPRSYQLMPPAEYNISLRPNQPPQMLRTKHHATAPSQLTVLKLLPTTNNHDQTPRLTHGKRHTLATQDPNLSKDLSQILSLIRVCLTAVLNLITINSLHLLRTVDCYSITRGEAQKNTATAPYFTLSLMQCRSQRHKSMEMISEEEPLNDTSLNPKIREHPHPSDNSNGKPTKAQHIKLLDLTTPSGPSPTTSPIFTPHSSPLFTPHPSPKLFGLFRRSPQKVAQL